MGLGHCPDGTHPPVGLVLLAVVFKDFPWGFRRPGEHRPQHDRIPTSSNRLDDVTGVLDPPVGNDRLAIFLGRRCRVVDGRNLWNPDPSNDPGRANRTWADPNFNHVDPGFKEGPGRVTSSNVAGDQCLVRIVGANFLDLTQNPGGVTVGRVDHDRISPGFKEGFSPFKGVGRDPYGGGH